MEVTTNKLEITEHPSEQCKHAILAVHDAMYVLGGKWKISIIACLLYGPKRFSAILRDVVGISGKMLSRELKEMETNLLVRRTVETSETLSVTYELTAYGHSVEPLISVLAQWGATHRKCIAKNR